MGHNLSPRQKRLPRALDSSSEIEVTRLQHQFAGLSLHSSRSSEPEDESDSEVSHPLPPPPPPPPSPHSPHSPPWRTTAAAFMPGASGANTISRSVMHVVSGSQKVANNHTSHSDHNHYAFIHININIHASEANVAITVISVGLFAGGDAKIMRCI